MIDPGEAFALRIHSFRLGMGEVGFQQLLSVLLEAGLWTHTFVSRCQVVKVWGPAKCSEKLVHTTKEREGHLLSKGCLAVPSA